MTDTPQNDQQSLVSPQQVVNDASAAEENPLKGIDPKLIEQANQRRVMYAPANVEPSQPEVTMEEPKPNENGSNMVHYIMEGAACIPIVGNVIALKDVAFDTYEICKTDEHNQHSNLKNIWLWVTLGVDGIGIIPAAGNASAPIRAVVRHGLWEFARGAGLALLIDKLVEVFSGQIEEFLLKLQSWIEELKSLLVDLIQKLGNSLADFIHSPFNWAKQVKLIEEGWTVWPSDNVKKIAFKGMEKLLDCLDQTLRQSLEQGMRDYSVQGAVMVGDAILKLMPLVIAITDAVLARRHRTKNVQAQSHVTNDGKAHQPAALVEQKGDCTKAPADNHPTPAKDKPGCSTCPKVEAKHRPPPRTQNPIHLVMGDENLWQNDFVVPGLIDLEWTRFYRSSCDMLDDSELGARWSTPYHLRFEQSDEQLFFIDDENRCVPLASLAVGESRYEPAEHITLSRPSEHEIVLETLYNDRQRYVRMGSANTAGRHVFRLVEVREQDGNALHFEYDTAQRLMTRITDGAAMDVRLTYNAEGLVERIERHFPDAEHAPEVLSHYVYDTQRDLVAQTDARDRTRTYRYEQHLLTFYANRNGLGCHLEWEWPGQAGGEPANAREARCIHNWLDDGSEDTRFEYNRSMWYTKVTDAQGLETFYRYNYFNRIESRTTPYQPHLGSEHWRWDEYGNLLAHIDGEGRTFAFEYDAKGRLIRFSDPMSRTMAFEYDEKGHQVKTIDPMGRTREMQYDSQNRVAADTDFAGRTTQFRYNDQSLPIKVIDPANNEYGYQWNEQGQLVASTDCSGQKTTYTYDHRGQLIEQTDALKQKIYFQRDRMGLPTVVRYPDGTTEQFEYDGEGNLTRYVNPTGEETRYAYDGKGLPVERIDAAGFRLAYQYDTLRRLSRLTNQNGEQWTFDYDGVGRLKQEVGFDGRTRKYQYDEGGMLLTYSEGDQATLYERDSTGLLKRKLIERKGHGIVETRYAHDMLGRLTSVQNSHSAVRLHYDALDNLIAEEQTADLPDGYHYRSVYRHTYDVLGNRQTTTLPNGQEVAWLRYGSGHVHAMSLDRQPLFDFERDALHRETARHYGVQQQTRQYDVMGRLTRQQRLLGDDAKQQRLYHYTQ
ncbi:DUF6531 domain-containing protein, partial [Zymobacter palmae]|uniref:DUF6531 domain-containing protein n=1 Tax=Zymobacter palmae TaxID=33074 RepID=UPI00048A2A41